ncbi:MAG: Ig-like domain-containing protein [Candidatus Dojkabacteria bacterium]
MIEEQIQVDENGQWDYKVPTNLAPGTYTITLRGTDLSGSPIEKPYTFTIQQSGTVNQPAPGNDLPTSSIGVEVIAFLSLILVMLAIWVYYLHKSEISFENKVLNE